MRLLQCTGTGFTLTKYLPPPNEIPPYAILSHTWGPDTEEVTMKDFVDGIAHTKAGYKKIEFCGQEASRNGLQYFWVDTCCIDKTNQAELTESLVSMYRWYQKAAVCYVYLTDVNSQGSGEQSDPAWSKDFRNSRWFTRGWTLQELLAPESVEFFTEDRVCLGNKRSLEQQIHDITGISIRALQCEDLSHFRVEERFRWAESRATSREEDLSYCLLGIFAVSMSVIYGEGRDNANRRLQQAISQQTYEPTLQPPLQPSLGKKRPFLLAFERNPDFTGRSPEMKRLRQMLPTRRRTMKIAITGLGGIGKTQLALEFVFQHEKQYPDCAVFWIPCVSSETIDQAYRVASRELGIPGHDDAQLNVKELLRDYLSSDKSGRWLLVFDNVDDLSVWEYKAAPSSRGLPDYLPKNDLGTIIFTTRDNKAAVKLASSNVINLSEMDESNSRQLLQNYIINKHLVKAEEDTKMLLKRLTYLPLAIVQAASFINMNHITLQDYICLLDEQETEQIELLNEDFDDDWRYQDVQNPVAKTWLISFTQIKQRDSLASDYLSFMACIDSKEIPKSLLPCPPGLPGKRQVEAIGTLLGYSFITKHATDNVFSMHRLVHIATRNWLRIENTLRTWTDKAVTTLSNALEDPDISQRAQWRSYMPHAHYVMALNSGPYNCGSHLFVLFKNFGVCLYYDGRYQDAEIYFRTLVEIYTTELGADHPKTLSNMNNLAIVYRNQGCWDDAERLGVQVMKARKAKLGADHPETLTSMNNLAIVYRNQGRWDDAKRLGVQDMEACKAKLGADHPDTLTSINNLAIIYEHQGHWDDAERLGVQVLEAWKAKLGADHPNTLTSINNLAIVYENQGRWDDAERLGLQVMEARKAKLGADHPETLTSMNNLATVYTNQGRWDDAKRLGEQVMEARKAKLGADHPDTLNSMCNVAVIWKSLCRHTDALNLMRSCVEASQRVISPNHPSTKIFVSFLKEWEE